MSVAELRPVGHGSVKCPRCRLTFPPPSFARQSWLVDAAGGRQRIRATCPHCGHAALFAAVDARW